MHWCRIRVFPSVYFLALGLSLAVFIPLGVASAATLPLPAEQDSWSDMAFAGGVAGSYDSTTNVLTLSGSPSNDLEIGPEFGPSNIGRHYGNGGTLGGVFAATLSLTGVVIDEAGSVSNGGSFSVVYNGPPAGSSNLAQDYGLVAGNSLLSGTVLEVLLDAVGDNTLDVLVEITGGALQNENPALGTNFAPNGRGLFRISGVALPSDWSQGFSLSRAVIDFHGIPEPATIALGVLGLGFACLSRLRPTRLKPNRE